MADMELLAAEPVALQAAQDVLADENKQVKALIVLLMGNDPVGGRCKELQQEIDSLGIQISNMKKRLSSIVNEHHFDSVQAFYKELNAAKKEYLDYQAACVEYEQVCGDKAPDTMSIRDRLRQKEQVVKIREAGRDDRTRHKDKGAR